LIAVQVGAAAAWLWADSRVVIALADISRRRIRRASPAMRMSQRASTPATPVGPLQPCPEPLAPVQEPFGGRLHH
jgi:hypothetical protein